MDETSLIPDNFDFSTFESAGPNTELYKALTFTGLALLTFVALPNTPLLNTALAFTGGAGISELQNKLITNPINKLFEAENSTAIISKGLFDAFISTTNDLEIKWQNSNYYRGYKRKKITATILDTPTASTHLEETTNFFKELRSAGQSFFVGKKELFTRDNAFSVLNVNPTNVIDLQFLNRIIYREIVNRLYEQSDFGHYSKYNDTFNEFIKSQGTVFTQIWAEKFKASVLNDTQGELYKAYEIAWRQNMTEIIKVVPQLQDQLEELQVKLKNIGIFDMETTLQDLLALKKPLEIWEEPFSFVNREMQIDKAVEYFNANPKGVFAITGPAGIGKSELANSIAIKLQETFIDGIIKIDFSELATLDNVYTVLGTKIEQGSINSVSQDATSLEAFLTHLNTKNILVILDNFNKAEFIPELRNLLPAEGSSGILITTQNQEVVTELGIQESSMFLETLSEENAVELFKKVVGEKRVTENTQHVRSILQSLYGLPLALDIAAKNLASFDERILSVQAYADVLSKEADKLSHLKRGNIAVETAFNVTFERLAPQTQIALIILASVESVEIEKNTGLIQFIMSTNEFNAATYTSELVNLSLIQFSVDNSFQMHPLIKLFAREKLNEQEDFSLQDLQMQEAMYLLEKSDLAIGLGSFTKARSLVQNSEQLFVLLNDEVGKLRASFQLAKIANASGKLQIVNRMKKKLISEESKLGLNLGISEWYESMYGEA